MYVYQTCILQFVKKFYQVGENKNKLVFTFNKYVYVFHSRPIVKNNPSFGYNYILFILIKAQSKLQNEGIIEKSISWIEL
jgi:hypothetical protein